MVSNITKRSKSGGIDKVSKWRSPERNVGVRVSELTGLDMVVTISEILDSKIDRRHHSCQLLYLVRWAGYKGTDEETSWILAMELRHAQELVSDFHQTYPDKPGPLERFA